MDNLVITQNNAPYATVEDLEVALGGFVINPFSDDDSNEPVDKFETYGRDIQWVIERIQTHPRTVFTFQDSDDGDKLILCGGYHLCNRIYYVATQNPVPLEYDYENICVVARDYETN